MVLFKDEFIARLVTVFKCDLVASISVAYSVSSRF